MALERKDLELLAAPFPVEAHKFLQGLIYLHEEPISERLDEVDPSWQFVIKSVITRANAGEGGASVATVVVHASLIIKGVSREDIGMAVVQRTKNGDAEANEAEKAASTDAFKRAARKFGIGRYLLTMGKGVITDDKKLASWLKQHYPNLGKGKEYSDESPEKPDHTDILDGAWNEEEMKKFWYHWTTTKQVHGDTVLKGLGVSKLSEWKDSFQKAADTMNEYFLSLK